MDAERESSCKSASKYLSSILAMSWENFMPPFRFRKEKNHFPSCFVMFFLFSTIFVFVTAESTIKYVVKYFLHWHLQAIIIIPERSKRRTSIDMIIWRTKSPRRSCFLSQYFGDSIRIVFYHHQPPPGWPLAHPWVCSWFLCVHSSEKKFKGNVKMRIVHLRENKRVTVWKL